MEITFCIKFRMHTPDTQKAINEIWRVVKPGGRVGAMMYHKNSFKWWYFIWLGKGVLRLKLLTYSSQGLANRYSDGAYTGGNMHTKFYTKGDFHHLWRRFEKMHVRFCDGFGTIDQLPHRTLPFAKYLLPAIAKRFLISRFGGLAWLDAQK